MMKILKIPDALHVSDTNDWKWEWETHTLHLLRIKADVLPNGGETALCLDGHVLTWWAGLPNIAEVWPKVTTLLLEHNILCEPYELTATQYPVDDMLSPK